MPLVTSPLFVLNSQYRPNIFLFSMTSANPLVLAQASVVVNGLGVASISKSTAYEVSGTYYFEFDVSKILQLSSAPKSQSKSTIFPDTLNVSYDVDNTDNYTEVGLIVSYYYNDPISGLLTQFATIDTIPFGYPAINATRQTKDWDNMGLESYILDYPSVGGVYDLYFLTNQRSVYPTAATKTNDPILICENESLSMTYIPSNNTNALRVVVYDENQNVIGIAGFITFPPTSDLIPRTIGAGVKQLIATTMFPSNPMTLIQTGYYYSIQAGNLTKPSSFILQGVKYMFKVIKCCPERSTRLHWMNRLGGGDAYTFRSKKTISERNKSVLAQKPITSWGYSLPVAQSYDKGAFKIQQETQKVYEVEGTFYTEQEGAWIAELLSSPEVYMETDYGLVSVVITDSNIKLVENDELLNITITFIESNNVSTQSN